MTRPISVELLRNALDSLVPTVSPPVCSMSWTRFASAWKLVRDCAWHRLELVPNPHDTATPAVAAAMFQAAMMDFPKTGLNPRRVTVPLPGG